jgi:hypothetical protein
LMVFRAGRVGGGPREDETRTSGGPEAATRPCSVLGSRCSFSVVLVLVLVLVLGARARKRRVRAAAREKFLGVFPIT